MQTIVTVETPIDETARVAQIRGMFDLAPTPSSRETWNVLLPIEEKPWNIGLVVGPSGCGKSTIARNLWPQELARSETLSWSGTQTILDAFPDAMSIKEVAELLSCVGFSSPPAWLRPFGVLSTGQRFRVALARLLADNQPLTVCDEFTSVVDRTVAQIGSAALARTVRRRRQRFIAVTCHEDIEPWLNPDWVYRPAEQAFAWRLLCPRPRIKLDIVRCHPSAWRLFAAHHYLSHGLNTGSVCFLACWGSQPVAFSAWIHFFARGPRARREHRTVTLPDFQGVGIGNALSATIASMWKALGLRALSTTTHPAMIAARNRSPLWRMSRAPSMHGGSERGRHRLKHAVTRLTAGFEYVGAPMPLWQARNLLAT